MKGNGDTRRNGALDHAITTPAVRRQNQEFDCWSKHIEDDMRFFIGSMRRLDQASVPLVTAVFQSDREAFTARAVRDGVRIGDFEASFLQVLAVIEHRAADEERAFGIDNQPHI